MRRNILPVVALTILAGVVSAEVPENFRRENLVAWCIVPFDAKKRGPVERAAMIKDLGLHLVAYDWRKEHVPTFEEEIHAYESHGLDMLAFWGGHEEAYALFEQYGLHPQVWKTVPAGKGETQEERVTSAADMLDLIAKRTGELGCLLGLYNHGGWGGEPENMVAVCEEMRRRGFPHVGIVYNFHHGHGDIEDWEAKFQLIKPHLICLNLNGMVPGGDKEGKKILTIGEGTAEAEMIRVVIKSEYAGPIGILDHRKETDSALTLRENLDGLETLLEKLGE